MFCRNDASADLQCGMLTQERRCLEACVTWLIFSCLLHGLKITKCFVLMYFRDCSCSHALSRRGWKPRTQCIASPPALCCDKARTCRLVSACRGFFNNCWPYVSCNVADTIARARAQSSSGTACRVQKCEKWGVSSRIIFDILGTCQDNACSSPANIIGFRFFSKWGSMC